VTLVVDRQQELGERPGTHALIVGISAYRHLPGGDGPPAPASFGLQSPSSAAITAFTLYDWLVARGDDLAAPLATCRLLLSPSAEELASHADVAGLHAGATLDAFLHAVSGWRDDARRHRENIALLYLVGLGIERPDGEQLFLLEDFGNGIGSLLRGTVTLSSIVNGMAPSTGHPGMARTQVYVLDASRRRPRSDLSFDWINSTPVFDQEVSGPDDRALLTIYAAAPGSPALAGKKAGSVLGQALIRCLDGGAADLLDTGQWGVTLSSLVRALPREVEEIARGYKRSQQVAFTGSFAEAVLVYLDSPPMVDVELKLNSQQSRSVVGVQLRASDGGVVFDSPVDASGPVRAELAAGLYSVTITLDTGDERPEIIGPRVLVARPPDVTWVFELPRP
jgi:hypothetical protein